MGWLQDDGWVAGLLVAAALAVAGLAWWAVRRLSPATPVSVAAARRQADLTFAAAVVVTLTVGMAAVLWLLEQADQVPAGRDRATLQTEAVKTGATIALGTGGAAYLLLAYRRQRLDEVDTRERRITELFTKAVEQLGHEKAPVRLGALYSLERLAQNNPEHRQTVVDVVCAYLRMPFTLPTRAELVVLQVGKTTPSADDQDQAPQPVPGRADQEELQVRLTAQRVLAAHLCLPPGISSAAAQRRRPSPRRAVWPGISLDLTGAALVDLNLERVSVVRAVFDEATFRGDARFGEATFQSGARFTWATFQDTVWFSKAAFQGGAVFHKAHFEDEAVFTGATFQVGVRFDAAIFEFDARFVEATFQGPAPAVFSYAAFKGDALLTGATFQAPAQFGDAAFMRDAWFDEATFQGDAWFDEATFRGDAWFDEATFQTAAVFDKATFETVAVFDKATFEGATLFGGAQVLHLDHPGINERRVWPDGYTVRPDPADPTRGTLVHAESRRRSQSRPSPRQTRPTDSGFSPD